MSRAPQGLPLKFPLFSIGASSRIRRFPFSTPQPSARLWPSMRHSPMSVEGSIAILTGVLPQICDLEAQECQRIPIPITRQRRGLETSERPQVPVYKYLVVKLETCTRDKPCSATTHRMMSGSTKNTPYPASNRPIKLTMVNRNLGV